MGNLDFSFGFRGCLAEPLTASAFKISPWPTAAAASSGDTRIKQRDGIASRGYRSKSVHGAVFHAAADEYGSDERLTVFLPASE